LRKQKANLLKILKDNNLTSPRHKLFTVNYEDIRSGKVTDAYFERTHRILETKKIKKRVRAEFTAKNLPSGWGIFTGLEEILGLFEGLPINIRSVPEGSVFKPFQPVMEIEGFYNDFDLLETAVLGLMCQSSGIATKSARCRIAAGSLKLLSFGARRMHPAISPMIERSSYIGGCDGVALVKGAELLQIPPVGTMPHSLVIIMGSLTSALKAFDEIIEKDVPRVAIVDTFGDEKFEALEAANCLHDRLDAIRIDTPSSRRGILSEILTEVRWELNQAGFEKVKLFVSGGIDEAEILNLREYVDGGFGIGTSISSASVVDYSMDIIDIEGKPVSKKGKLSGGKHLLRCNDCFSEEVIPIDKPYGDCDLCGGEMSQHLASVMENGEKVKSLPSAKEIQNYVLLQIDRFSLDLK
tara:strand:- start:1566 stop:2798 length:1233 start_codon:yes stop_codon:yes gene_type:complete